MKTTSINKDEVLKSYEVLRKFLVGKLSKPDFEASMILIAIYRDNWNKIMRERYIES